MAASHPMLPPELFSASTLASAATGAALGLGIALVGYVVQDWTVLWHRFEKRLAIARGKAEAHYWPDMPEGYSANTLSDKERAALPRNFALMALGGAAWLVSIETGSELLQFLVLASVSLFTVVYLLVSDDAEEVGAALDGEAPRLGRLRRIGGHLFGLFALAFTTLESLSDAVVAWFAHGPRVAVYGAIAAVVLLVGMGAWNWWSDPEAKGPEVAIPREALYGFIGALIIVVGLIGAATLL